MDWIIYLIAAAALVALYGFHRLMSGIERRESLEGRGVVGVVVSAQAEGRTVIVDTRNGSKHATNLGIFVVVRTARGWFESTRQNVPLECRVNPDTSHMSEWVFPDIGDDAIEQIDVRVRTPREPYRVALRLPLTQEVIFA